MIKTDVFQQFFTLLPSDMDIPLIEKYICVEFKFKVMQSTLLCRKSVKAKKSEPVMSKYYFSFYNSK